MNKSPLKVKSVSFPTVNVQYLKVKLAAGVGSILKLSVLYVVLDANNHHVL